MFEEFLKILAALALTLGLLLSFLIGLSALFGWDRLCDWCCGMLMFLISATAGFVLCGIAVGIWMDVLGYV